MLARIRENALKTCGLSAGQTVLVGVSGGPDSLCLLDALYKLEFRVIAAYFNHQLRPEAAEESRAVERLAARMGIPFAAGQGDVAGEARRRGQSVEAAARALRYDFLFARARDFHAQAVAVGHNANDQVETVWMHLLRGSGLDGLRGMAFRSMTPWDGQIPLVRPLLSLWRDEILAYCAENGLQPAVDGSNLEPVYFRNRLRLETLPEIERLAPGAGKRIWNLSQLAWDDLQLLETLEQEAWEKCAPEVGEDSVQLGLGAFRARPEALQRRLLRRAAALLRPAGDGLNLENTARAAGFVRSPGQGRQIELGQKLILRLEGDRLRLAGREHRPDLSAYPVMEGDELLPLGLPGSLELANGWTLVAESCIPPDADAFKRQRGELQFEAWLDAGALAGPLAVRKPIAGDRFQPLGLSEGSQKLSDFWINRRIPAVARRAWPLVLCGDQIAWVPGFAPAHAFRVQAGTRRCVHLKIWRRGK